MSQDFKRRWNGIMAATDENSPYVEPYALEDTYSCLDFFHSVDDPFSKQLVKDYNAMFKDTNYLLTAGTASTGMYRGIKLYEQGVIATNGDLARRQHRSIG